MLTATVELESCLKGDMLLRGGHLGGVYKAFRAFTYLRLVVLFVVKLHNLARVERLQRIVAVREVGARVRHCVLRAGRA